MTGKNKASAAPDRLVAEGLERHIFSYSGEYPALLTRLLGRRDFRGWDHDSMKAAYFRLLRERYLGPPYSAGALLAAQGAKAAGLPPRLTQDLCAAAQLMAASGAAMADYLCRRGDGARLSPAGNFLLLSSFTSHALACAILSSRASRLPQPRREAVLREFFLGPGGLLRRLYGLYGRRSPPRREAGAAVEKESILAAGRLLRAFAGDAADI